MKLTIEKMIVIDINYSELPAEFVEWLTTECGYTYRDTGTGMGEHLYSFEDFQNDIPDNDEMQDTADAIIEALEENDAAYFRVIDLPLGIRGR